jgi:hypothetical protein
MAYIGRTPTNAALTSSDLADGIVTAAKIEDGGVVAAEIASNAVTTAKINADAVTGAKIADDAINSEHYTDGSIDTAHIAADQITNAKIADDQIDSEHYVDGSIDTAHIADGQITTAKLSTAVFTGATDIGANIADADLFLLDDGAGGTIRKTAASRIKTYIGTADFGAIGEHALPSADDTYDLGSASKQWRNIYTGDLHLSNKSKAEGNVVDGTTGDWTIQEGSEDLFILNNKSGKRYKFKLEEV